tara:strand:- start:9999 stop:10367 length:369 start_codon:yes stop_codon:yes gene_type:complete
MIKEQFNINILSDDPMFCTRFAIECNKFGFSLNFFDKVDIPNKSNNLFGDFLSVAVIDIDNDNLDIAKLIKRTSKIPVFGVYTKYSKSLQSKAKKNDFDLVFTKSLLISSIKRIIVHIANEK